MEVKNTWTEEDFDLMDWHDSHIHSISFPAQEPNLTFDLDYLFEWVLNGEFYKFWVSPCTLTFLNVLYLKVNLDFQNSVGLDILSIERSNSRPTPNLKMTLWNYTVETEKGIISFEATGFLLKVNKQPVLSQSQILKRG